MGAANDGLRLLLERSVLFALGYWGFKTGEGPVRWLLGLGGPLLAAVVWAVFVTPKGSLAGKTPSAWCSNSRSSGRGSPRSRASGVLASPLGLG